MEIATVFPSRTCIVKEVITDAVVPRNHRLWKILHFQLSSSVVTTLQILKSTHTFVARFPHSIYIPAQVRNSVTADMNEA